MLVIESERSNGPVEQCDAHFGMPRVPQTEMPRVCVYGAQITARNSGVVIAMCGRMEKG